MSDFKYKDFEYDDFTYDDWSYKDYEESEQVKQYLNNLNNHNASKPGEYQSKYQAVADEALNNYMNRDEFSYDLNGDALYQQYKDKYVTQGKLASQDTMAQAAAMTGGYGNSYAATVGNQAYQASLQNLNDVVPELYQMAYNQYQQEGQDMLNKYSIYMDRENAEYGRYRDTVADWETERDYLTNLYNTERSLDYSKYTDNRNFDYSVYSDNRDFAYNQYSSDRNLAYTQYDSDKNLAYTDYRNDIADQQWKATFDQALAEFNYQKQRDTIADQQWQSSYNAQVEANKLAAKENAYTLSKSQENEYMKLISGGKYADAEAYIDKLLDKGLSEAQAGYWLSLIPDSYYKSSSVSSKAASILGTAVNTSTNSVIDAIKNNKVVDFITSALKKNK